MFSVSVKNRTGDIFVLSEKDKKTLENTLSQFYRDYISHPLILPASSVAYRYLHLETGHSIRYWEDDEGEGRYDCALEHPKKKEAE